MIISSPPQSDSLFFIYGPPGSGKTTVGCLLSEALNLPFIDLDIEIQNKAGKDIPSIFAEEGEPGFRARERSALQDAAQTNRAVVALGGGALLSDENRGFAETNGTVICLLSDQNSLIQRLESESGIRPLLGGESGWKDRLESLLARRKDHYTSFSHTVDTTNLTPQEAVWQTQIELGAFRITGMKDAYDVRVVPNSLDQVGSMLFSRGLKGPIALVGDENILPIYASRVEASLTAAGFRVQICAIPAGENHKTLETISSLWGQFLSAGLERGSTIVAIGGGVTTDLAGFAAAAYLRGVAWVAIPTSLLAMIDASLGGKTGFDLPQGKNLVGAFHPPSLVIADPAVLKSLPQEEIRSGMAEVVKHGVIADPILFERCAQGWESVRGPDLLAPDWTETVRRAIAVKVHVVNQDPFEKGLRASLNLGHTIGHAVESASNYKLRHGESVAIGMAAVARLAEERGLCDPGLTELITRVLSNLGLPIEIPRGLNPTTFINSVKVDKKRAGGLVRFAVPVRIGEVKTGIVLEVDFATLLPEAS